MSESEFEDVSAENFGGVVGKLPYGGALIQRNISEAERRRAQARESGDVEGRDAAGNAGSECIGNDLIARQRAVFIQAWPAPCKAKFIHKGRSEDARISNADVPGGKVLIHGRVGRR